MYKITLDNVNSLSEGHFDKNIHVPTAIDVLTDVLKKLSVGTKPSLLMSDFALVGKNFMETITGKYTRFLTGRGVASKYHRAFYVINGKLYSGNGQASAATVLNLYKNGAFAHVGDLEKDLQKAIDFGLYDWFCSDSRAAKLVLKTAAPMVDKLFNSPLLNPNLYFIQMKNPGTFDGPSGLYIQLVNIMTDKVEYVIDTKTKELFGICKSEPIAKGLKGIYNYFGLNTKGQKLIR